MVDMKKVLLATILSVLVSVFGFAHGKGDVEEISVENMNSWQEQFDLDIRKPGKYNIMITARDLGGNVHIEGPHNIYLDPKSDLPICGITNPYPSMRVVGNLNIVGTCVDDDGVSRVDLILDEGTKIVDPDGGYFSSSKYGVVKSDGSTLASPVVFADKTSTAIDGITTDADAEVIGIYDAQGRKFEEINIIRMSDGTTKKIIKK